MSTLTISASAANSLLERIERRSARAGVIGLGYVGLPLAVEIGLAGFSVVGVDKSEDKVRRLQAGDCYIPDIDAPTFEHILSRRRFAAFQDESVLKTCDCISVCVPTPLRKTKDPDLGFVLEAAEAISRNMQHGTLIILESTTYPGTTEELVLPILERSGYKVGVDFFLCFSPERVDPGNERYKTRKIPKVIGGATETCRDLGVAYYSRIVDNVVPVSSPSVAEMVKLLENTFRMINIGLANEMAIMCRHMNIDVWEVIEAASTKPFGFMPFFPGPGLGGHCIPVDPHYLSWKTKQVGYEPRFIQLASEINGRMPAYVVERLQAALNARKKAVNGSRVHVIGVAYKRDVSDTRESPAIDVIGLLQKQGAEISYTDPFVPSLEVAGRKLQSQPLKQAAAADCSVILTDHTEVDYSQLVETSSLIIDARNALGGLRRENIVRL